MTCSKCGKEVVDNMLTCIACTLKLNDAAIRRAQYEPLLMVAAGKGVLQGYRCADGLNHVRMFQSDMCFCGTPAEAPRRKRSEIDWGSNAMNCICHKCRAAILEIYADAADAQVQA